MGIVNQSTTEYSSAVGFGNCCKMCNSCLRGEKLQLLQNQQQLSLLQLCSSLNQKCPTMIYSSNSCFRQFASFEIQKVIDGEKQDPLEVLR